MDFLHNVCWLVADKYRGGIVFLYINFSIGGKRLKGGEWECGVLSDW
jgi:hypothetical protein